MMIEVTFSNECNNYSQPLLRVCVIEQLDIQLNLFYYFSLLFYFISSLMVLYILLHKIKRKYLS